MTEAFDAYKKLARQHDELLEQMDDCWWEMTEDEHVEAGTKPPPNHYDHDKVEQYVEDARRGTGPAIWVLLDTISGLHMTTRADFQADLVPRFQALSTAEQANALYALANEACAAVTQRAREHAELARRRGEI